MRAASRMAGIQPFHVMELLARARALEAAGRSIVHLEIGEPDFPTPAPVVAAARGAIAGGEMRYTPALGLPALREAIAGYYARCHGLSVDPQRIAVTPGASGALLLALGALVEPGQKVLMADPGYPCNRNFAHFLGAVPQPVPVGPDTGYQLTPTLIERHLGRDTAAVLLASPANPTGTTVSAGHLAEIAALLAARDRALIVDEIYQGLVYDGRSSSALAQSDQVYVLNSFSKYFGMTGWRVGWLVAPPGRIRDIDLLAQNLFLAAPTPGQHAALAALNDETLPILEQRRLEFQRRRDYLLPALRDLGFRIPVSPQGAFYLYADCRALAEDSDALARDLLETAGVAVTPGRDFGDNHPEAHLRFAYTTSMDRLEEGVRRIATYLQSR